ncbi:MAG: archaeosortase/exosortase family protein [Acidobacteria bacterium]|nr:archaeosortase/exosortase family protein [Acidobacteriota bacterium]
MRRWPPVVAVCLLWLDLVRQLSYQWASSDQYSYGWLVPILAAALLYARWRTRPDTRVEDEPWWMGLGAIAIAILLVPLRVIHEVNPDWPSVSWPLALSVVGLCLYVVFRFGGWPWVRHFAFPIAFIVVAVRWPWRLEHPLTQGLMGTVAALTVELLDWLGVPSMQQGNWIELRSATVGIDEACSGIRSLQSTIMAGLFLGEFHLLHWRHRLLLILVGTALAFCLNVVRSLALCWRASTGGIGALASWHDPIGVGIFVVLFGCLWLLSCRFPADPSLAKSPASSVSPGIPSPRFAFGALAWVVLLLSGTELWFQSHEAKRYEMIQWSVVLPIRLPTYREKKLTKREAQLLKYDQQTCGAWHEPDGKEWMIYYFRWLPGSIHSRLEARCHSPTFCLPAAGLLLKEDAGLRPFHVDEIAVPFNRYTFDDRGKSVHVFFCLWEDGAENLPKQRWDLSGKDRLLAAFTAKRRVGQRTLEVIMSGYQTLGEAEAALEHRLPHLLRIERGRKRE